MSIEGVPLRVLVLEDSVDDCDLLVVHLRRANYDPHWRRVDNAQDLMAALDEEWDVVLSDYSMPRFTALDGLALIKKRRLDVPFIVVSGTIGERAAVDAMKAGAHDIFLKDNVARLPAAIERERAEARIREEHRRAVQELRESQEQLRAAVRARDEFLSIASHELRTPLTSLTLQVAIGRKVLESAENAETRLEKITTKLDGVSRQISKLTMLINNLLEVARATSKRMRLSLESFDLREALNAAVAEMQDSIRRSRTPFTVRADTPLHGTWDRLRVESVIFNLIANAVKYGNGKPVTVELEADDGRARLVVKDQGIGIGQDERHRLFQKFERAVPDKHYGGFGLGLWLTREIVEAHGGTISVTSQTGEGSTFTVLLPLEATRAEQP